LRIINLGFRYDGHSLNPLGAAVPASDSIPELKIAEVDGVIG